MKYSITPLLTGVRNPDQGIMTYQQGYGKRIWLPIWAFLLVSEDKKILVDTGLDENELFVPPAFTEETGLEAHSIVDCLAAEGLTPDDIDVVINTHLHDDHCGNNALFNRATFYAHPEEIKFCNDPHPLDHRYDNYFIEEINFTDLPEDGRITEGIRVIFSPGHTVGCLSVEVETNDGTAIITGFCCNKENFPASGPAICPGVHLDALAAWQSIQNIKETGAAILPMHELGLQKIG